jgi:hypothetical protein
MFRIWLTNPKCSLGRDAAEKMLHLALLSIASCISGEGESELQKACANPPRSFSHLIRIATQVVVVWTLEELSTVAALR